LINVQDFRVNGPVSVVSSSSFLSSNGSSNGVGKNHRRRNHCRDNRNRRRSPVKRAQTASSANSGTALPSLLANAHGEPVPLGISGRNRRRPTTTGGIKKSARCPGKYCDKKKKSEENKTMSSILYKSLVEDKYEGKIKDNRMTRGDRAKLYTTVSVCESCYIQYIEKDRVRAKIKNISNERAEKMLAMATQKYQKYGSGAPKIKPGSSRVEKLYEKEKQKYALPPSLRAILRREKISESDATCTIDTTCTTTTCDGKKIIEDMTIIAAAQKQEENEPSEMIDEVTRRVRAAMEEKKEFDKEYPGTAAMEEIDIQVLLQENKNITENSDSDCDDDNICLLCSEDVNVCKCNLSPRVDVRALIGRVIPDLFE